MAFVCDLELSEAEAACREQVADARRIVIKVGTSSLTHQNGQMNLRQLDLLSQVIADLMNRGFEVVLVTSAAIAVGMHRLRLKERPTELKDLQAVASIGQADLMTLYRKFLNDYNHICGQILLTRDDVDDEITRNNLINTFEALLERHVLPIVNENDSVSTTEVYHNGTFGDNDMLSAIVAELIHADALFLLSDVDGLYKQDPRTLDEALIEKSFISYVGKDEIDFVKNYSGGAGSSRGTGGMRSKIAAAEHSCQAGIPMLILHGKDPRTISQVLEGERYGTIFDPNLPKD